MNDSTKRNETSSGREDSLVTIGGQTIGAGLRQRADIPVAQLPTQAEVSIPVEVVNGSQPGPRLWVDASIHGDEINGVEIVRELLEVIDPQMLRGTLVAVPIVNVFGFINESRYLPDRRDLNRSFPGSRGGSLAARIAHLFMSEIVSQCTHGIDLHTGSNDRTNLPHVRAKLDDPETRRVAEAFGAPVMLDSAGPKGSLRRAVAKKNKPILVFEGGEPKRFNEDAVEVGLNGTLRVMRELGMIDMDVREPAEAPREGTGTKWIRARRAGILRLRKYTGAKVAKGDVLGTIGDAFLHESTEVRAPCDGLIISHVTNPLVHQGDALVHIVEFGE
jgi:hypothetical protein